jgi:hypothetical protein
VLVLCAPVAVVVLVLRITCLRAANVPLELDGSATAAVPSAVLKVLLTQKGG